MVRPGRSLGCRATEQPRVVFFSDATGAPKWIGPIPTWDEIPILSGVASEVRLLKSCPTTGPSWPRPHAIAAKLSRIQVQQEGSARQVAVLDQIANSSSRRQV